MMQTRTITVLALVLLVLGIGFYSLDAFAQESKVTFVGVVQEEPGDFAARDHVLVGIPVPMNSELWQPVVNVDEVVLVNGTEILQRYQTQVVRLENGNYSWTESHQRIELASGNTTWVANRTWETPSTTWVFQMRDAEDRQNERPMWAFYQGVLPEGIPERPSQLTGGARMSGDGSFIWDTEEFTVGCSSKFLPEDLREEFDPDGDGQTD